jgi:hypothetical protein
MKHIKLFEDFINESINEAEISPDAFDKLEKLVKELLNMRLDESKEYHEYRTPLTLLKYEIMVAKHKGDPSAEKLEKKREALNQKRLKAPDRNILEFEDKIKEDPEMSKILKKLGKFEYKNYKTDIFNLISRLSSDQVGVKGYAELISGLKKISPKDLTEDQYDRMTGDIRNQTDYLNSSKENLPGAVKSLNDAFAKIKELKAKAEKGGKSSPKKTDADKIKDEYEKKIEALDKKADRHYSKGEDVPREDIQDILIPLLQEIRDKKIKLAGLDEEAKKKAEAEIEKLEQKYEEEYQNYEDDVDRERMGRR